MRVRRYLIPLAVYVLTLVAGWLVSHAKQQVIRECIRGAEEKQPVIVTDCKSRKFWPLRLHTLGGDEIPLGTTNVAQPGGTSDVFLTGDGKLCFWHYAMFFGTAELWEIPLPKTVPRLLGSYRSDDVLNAISHRVPLWTVPDVPWRAQQSDDGLRLYNYSTGAVKHLEPRSSPPWAPEEEGQERAIYELFLSPDASCLVAACFSRSQPKETNIFRYDIDRDEWAQIAQGPFFLSECTVGPGGDVIALFDLSATPVGLVFLDGRTGETLLSIPGSTAPAIGRKWAGCVEYAGGPNYVLRIFDMEDDWRSYRIPISDQVLTGTPGSIARAIELALYEPDLARPARPPSVNISQ
jgi:hypothetical protein